MQITSFFPLAKMQVARTLAPAGGPSWQHLRQVSYRRAVAALVLLAFLPVVSAMVVCEAECLAWALAGGSMPVGDDHARHDGHDGGDTVPGGHLLEAGPCHMGATPIFVRAFGVAVEPVPTGNQWLSETTPRFASVAWPPPQPRPKLSFS